MADRSATRSGADTGGPVLVAGGDRDPNLASLARVLEERDREVLFLRVGRGSHPWILWDLEADRLVLDGREVRPRSAFVRYDVFNHLEDRRPESAFRAAAWYTAVTGWLGAHPEVRLPNRASLHHTTNKPHVLHLAREAGLAIPRTRITNHLGQAAGPDPARPAIVKPINGGGHTRRLAEVREQIAAQGAAQGEARGAAQGEARGAEHGGDVAAAPAIVQDELVQPEVRVYGVGGTFLAFSMISEDLDYRERQSARVEPLPKVPDGLVPGLERLMERLGLDFAAADFKTCADTGRLLFLEINTGPMFAAFDHASGGAVSHALADFLDP